MRLSFEVAASNGFTSLVLQTDSHEQIRTSWEAIEMRTACATANTSPMTSAVYPRVKAVTAAFGNTGRMPFAATKMALSMKLAMPGCSAPAIAQAQCAVAVGGAQRQYHA